MSQRDPLWNIDALAQYLGVPVATIYTWRKNGHGPKAFRVGRHLRWRESEVQAWLERQRDEQFDDRWQDPVRRAEGRRGATPR
jgi:excisionase family DNA binding protein